MASIVVLMYGVLYGRPPRKESIARQVAVTHTLTINPTQPDTRGMLRLRPDPVPPSGQLSPLRRMPR